MENNGGSSCGGERQKLSRVVSDCVRRWFQDTLKEAKAGDLAMQVLVGQMYYNGYGVPKDAQKVNSLSYPVYACVSVCVHWIIRFDFLDSKVWCLFSHGGLFKNYWTPFGC